MIGEEGFPQRFLHFLDKAGLKRRMLTRELLGLRACYLDLSPLRLRFSDLSLVISVPRADMEEQSPRQIHDTLKDVTLQLHMVLVRSRGRGTPAIPSVNL